MMENIKSNNYIGAYLTFENAFSLDECNKLIEFFEQNEHVDAKLLEPDIYITNTKISFLTTHDFELIYEKLLSYINQANYYFNLDISDLKELQIVKCEKDGVYDWHTDIGYEIKATRKISIIVFLSKPEDYQGGEINFSMVEPKVDRIIQKQGTILLFPSIRPYISENIDNGSRFTLNGWMHGKSFR